MEELHKMYHFHRAVWLQASGKDDSSRNNHLSDEIISSRENRVSLPVLQNC